MGTRGETLYYLFHKSRATPVSPGLLTQSWPLIGQCCSVPSSDWWRGSPSPARPHLSSEHGIRDDRENRTEHNNLSTPAGPQQLCKLCFDCLSHKIDNTSNFVRKLVDMPFLKSFSRFQCSNMNEN